MKKLLIALGIVVVLVVLFFTVRIFPSNGGCVDLSTLEPTMSKCINPKQTGYEYFYKNNGSIKDLIYIYNYNKNTEKQNEIVNKQIEDFKNNQPTITIEEIKAKLQQAKEQNIQNETIGKYNDMLVVIQKLSRDENIWYAVYGGEYKISEQKCSEINGNPIKLANGYYNGCSPI